MAEQQRPPSWPTPAQLAYLSSTMHWRLEQLAYDLPAGRVSVADQLRLAEDLKQLGGALQSHAESRPSPAPRAIEAPAIDHGQPRPGGMVDAEIPPGVCVHVDDNTRRMCMAAATWHGITDTNPVDAFESCDVHHDALTWMADVKWIHRWAPDCAHGQFSTVENRCLPTSCLYGTVPYS
jgi:hypothetical protein